MSRGAGLVARPDLAHNAIGVIGPDRSYPPSSDWRAVLVDRGPDGRLYTLANQPHHAPALNHGRDETQPPCMIFSPLLKASWGDDQRRGVPPTFTQ